MQQYEFCVVDLHDHTLVVFTQTGQSSLYLFKDIALGDRHDDDATARKVAELGLAGWQLVGASTESHGVRETLFFQRQIQ